MAYKIPESEDIKMKLKVKLMKNKEVTSEISKIIKQLNRKMKNLESSGLYRYSKSYSKLLTYTNEQLESHYFSSKKFSNSSLKQRQDFLIKLYKMNQYEGLTKKSLVEHYNKSAEKLSTGSLKLTASDIMAIDEKMGDWREFILSSNIADIFSSSEAREIFTQRTEMTQEQFNKFMKNLNKFNTGTYKKIDFDLFLRYYDYDKGEVIAERNGIKFNPINGIIYTPDGKRTRRGYKISADGETLITSDNDGKFAKALSDFESGDKFYEYIFNHKRGKL